MFNLGKFYGKLKVTTSIQERRIFNSRGTLHGYTLKSKIQYGKYHR